MAKDYIRTYGFGVHDQDGTHIGASTLEIAPESHVAGPGIFTICGPFRETFFRFLANTEERTVTIHLFDKESDASVGCLDLVIQPADAKTSPIQWDAVKDEVLKIKVALPYMSLRLTGPGLLERLASAAASPEDV